MLAGMMLIVLSQVRLKLASFIISSSQPLLRDEPKFLQPPHIPSRPRRSRANHHEYPRTELGCVQAVQAAQITFEDFFLSSMDVPALKIVGFEGLWGAGAMLLVLLPIVQRLPGKDGAGLHEDSVDTLHVR